MEKALRMSGLSCGLDLTPWGLPMACLSPQLPAWCPACRGSCLYCLAPRTKGRTEGQGLTCTHGKAELSILFLHIPLPLEPRAACRPC